MPENLRDGIENPAGDGEELKISMQASERDERRVALDTLIAADKQSRRDPYPGRWSEDEKSRFQGTPSYSLKNRGKNRPFRLCALRIAKSRYEDQGTYRTLPIP